MMLEISAAIVALILIVGGFFLGRKWGFKAMLLSPIPLLISFAALLALPGGEGYGIASLIAAAVIVIILVAGAIATAIFSIGILVGALVRRRYRYYWWD